MSEQKIPDFDPSELLRMQVDRRKELSGASAGKTANDLN